MKRENKLKYSQEEYKKLVKEIDKKYEVIGEYKGSNIPTEIFCNNCKQIITRTTNQLKKRGCPYCNNIFIAKGYNDLWITNKEMAELLTDPDDCLYHMYSRHKTNFTCKTCGKIHYKSIYSVSTYGIRCDNCDDGFSYPEKFIRSILIQSGIKFDGQKEFDFLKNKKYDFYIKHKNAIIETHGGQHYLDNFRFKTKTRNEKENDKIKRTAAINNGIYNYYEIDCSKSEREYIRQSIIDSGLLDFLEVDINSIDFVQCEIDASNSLMKQTWDLWNTTLYTNIEIAEKLSLSPSTTSHYLNVGSKIGICNYNGQEERNKASSHKVVLTNTGEIFNSIEEAQKKYNIKNIVACCMGKIKSAGKDKDGNPLIWVYLENYDEKKDYKYNNKVIKKIICLETNEIFDKIIDGANAYNIKDSTLSLNLRGKNTYAGRHNITKMPLHWMYYDEYLSSSKEYIQSIIDKTPLQYSSIICLNDFQIFESATEALTHCGIKSVSNITDCCKDKIETAGYVNGERARWMYYSDYIKLYNKNDLEELVV